VSRVDRLLARGDGRLDRWMAGQAPADLDAAIALFTEADAMLPNGDSRRMALDGYFGLALAGRYRQSESADDLDRAIERLSRVASASDDADFDGSRLVLGQALATRIELSGQPNAARVPDDAELIRDLETAMSALAAAARSGSVFLSAAQRAEAARLRAYLAPKLTVARAMAARNAGGLADAGEIEEALRETPADHPNRRHLILELGRVHLVLALSDSSAGSTPGTSPHREPAVRYLSMAADQLGPADPQRETPKLCLALLDLSERLQLASHAKAPWDAAMSDRVRELTAQILADPSLGAEFAGQLHLFAGMAERVSAPDSAVTHLNQALSLDPESRSVRGASAAIFAGLLSGSDGRPLSLDDLAAAEAAERQARELVDRTVLAGDDPAGLSTAWLAQGLHPALGRASLAGDRLRSAFLDRDLAGLDRALAEVDRLLAELPADNECRCLAVATLGLGLRLRGELSGDRDDAIRGLRLLAAAYRDASSSVLIGRIMAGRMVQLRLAAATASVELAMVTGDLPALTTVVQTLSGLGESAARAADRASWARAYGLALIWRHQLTGDLRDRDHGIAKLEQAVQIAADGGQDIQDYALLQNLSVAYRSRGSRSRRDPERGIDAGLRALRQRAAIVLLQGGSQQGLQLARWHGFAQVVQLANWCAADGRLDQAVEALELGRALVLYAATVAADIPELLTAAGRPELADEWRAEAAAGPAHPADPEAGPFSLADAPAVDWSGEAVPQLRVPSQLRRQVIAALRGSAAGRDVLDPPRPTELAAALRRAGADALVYLIPPLAAEPGYALLIGSDGSLRRVSLPGLSDTAPLDAYESASLAAWGEDSANADLPGWDAALEALCDWAWTAAMGPLLEHARTRWPGRTPRLVLVPIEKLGLVPWHAARTADDRGRPRYALAAAVLSYAASAAQFARAASRSPRPPAEAPVLLGNPTDDLPCSESEVAELLRRDYPEAAYFGRPAGLTAGPGTPAEILARLPGGSGPLASLLHLGCHATVGRSLADSCLLLSAYQPLPVATILAAARHHPSDGPGYLAVLSACMTDLADTDHDEALTLASALLAAGASGVIGARWRVDDRFTAPLMVMFHHFLNNGHPDPADALRAAQLWALDRNRPALDDLPDDLADLSGRASLALPRYWAAFTCHGAHAGSGSLRA
jgi:tetratricopeptide (TPR) repeat protein